MLSLPDAKTSGLRFSLHKLETTPGLPSYQYRTSPLRARFFGAV